jgi:Mrp family chromosome partitioning ATPase
MSSRFEILPGTVTTPSCSNSKRSRREDHVAQEELSNLVRNVFLAPESGSPCTVVAFCGVDAGSGWISAGVGQTLADRVSGTVCLVDANFESPYLHQHFQIENKEGFFDSLQRTSPIHTFVRRTWGSKLWLITAGTAGDVSEPFASGRLRERIAELRGRFDFVLIDAPPVNLCPDALEIGRLAGGVILVVDGHSTREAARLAKQSLEVAKVSMLGLVFDRRTRTMREVRNGGI